MDIEKEEWFNSLPSNSPDLLLRICPCGSRAYAEKLRHFSEERERYLTAKQAWIEEHYPHRDMIKKESHDDGVMVTNTLQFDEPEKVDPSLWLMSGLPTVDDNGNINAAYQCPNCEALRGGQISIGATYCPECQKRVNNAVRSEYSGGGISEGFAGALRHIGLVGTLKPVDSSLGANSTPFPGTAIFEQPKSYEYTPQKDITAYETALLIPMLGGGFACFSSIEDHPHWEENKRHFTEID